VREGRMGRGMPRQASFPITYRAGLFVVAYHIPGHHNNSRLLTALQRDVADDIALQQL
jgi:hypothetical protein